MVKEGEEKEEEGPPRSKKQTWESKDKFDYIAGEIEHGILQIRTSVNLTNTNVAYTVGAVREITCLVEGTVSNVFMFSMSHRGRTKRGVYLQTYSVNDSRITVGRRYKEELYLCREIIQVTLRLTTIFDFFGRKMQCCAYLKVNNTQNSVLTAQCDAVVQQSSILVWRLYSPLVVWNWEIPYNISNVTYAADARGVSVVVHPNSYNSCGYTKFTEMNITLKRAIEGLSLVCIVKNKPYDIYPSLELRSQTIVFPGFDPQAPRLLFEIVDSENASFALVNVACDAYVGTPGVLTWVLRVKQFTSVWRVTAGNKTRVEALGRLHPSNVTATEAYSKDGTYLNSHILLDLSIVKDLRGRASLTCYSYNVTDQLHVPHGANNLKATIVFDFAGNTLDAYIVTPLPPLDKSDFYKFLKYLVIIPWVLILGIVFILRKKVQQITTDQELSEIDGGTTRRPKDTRERSTFIN
ncbi:hypothetical protein PoB_006016500 [Plakobranchus ocellatus]|uniref:Ig-like domain-containing protein n=1 Tax=Plakobranchus ocellatus TaxID=259542 RepID=A0AAV4CP55_9GAST|nr:hypothetical protein PoB_006016500 [Plakobranchus ocellatus]